MTQTAETEDGHKLEIWTDEGAESPRDWDNLGRIVCWHRRYNLGDKHDWARPEDFQGWAEKQKGLLLLPVYMYDHGGIALSTGRAYPFNCPWDSGQVGWIYLTAEKAREEYSVKRLSAKTRARALAALRGEVEVLSQYANGQVYGYTFSGPEATCGECGDKSREVLESCGGFYGNLRDSGMFDELPDKYRDELAAAL